MMDHKQSALDALEAHKTTLSTVDSTAAIVHALLWVGEQFTPSTKTTTKRTRATKENN